MKPPMIINVSNSFVNLLNFNIFALSTKYYNNKQVFKV